MKKNVTFADIAEYTGFSKTTISRYFNNPDSVTIENQEKIANALEVKVDDLFYSELDIDNLKEEMYFRIDEYGIDSKEVLEVSQVIDLLINIKMNKD